MSRTNWAPHVSEKFNHPSMKVLEVGSRVVTGASYKSLFDKVNYIGFDVHAEDNIDIVDDVHKLISFFDEHEKFDLMPCTAVVKHLHMPWIALQEMTSILKVGGNILSKLTFLDAPINVHGIFANFWIRN